MELSGIREQMEQQQKELIDTLRAEREIILMEVEQMLKKQKEEMIDALRAKIEEAEDNIYKDMCRAVSVPADNKYRGYVVQAGKDF